jgi:hypothetical protein
MDASANRRETQNAWRKIKTTKSTSIMKENDMTLARGIPVTLLNMMTEVQTCDESFGASDDL